MCSGLTKRHLPVFHQRKREKNYSFYVSLQLVLSEQQFSAHEAQFSAPAYEQIQSVDYIVN